MTAEEYKLNREKLQLTQSGLASLLEVSRETVSRRESEKLRITEEAALALMMLVQRSNLS